MTRLGVIEIVLIAIALIATRKYWGGGASSQWLVARKARPLVRVHSDITEIGEFAWLLVPVAVLGSFVVATGPQPFMLAMSEAWFQNGRQETAASPTIPPLAEAVDGIETTPVSVSSKSTSLPDWCRQQRTSEGDVTRVVLASRQYSTKAEAENELVTEAVRLLTDDLGQIQSGVATPRNWKPTTDQVLIHAVRKRFEEVSDHDFGSFTHPMHRVWWQVELSPSVRVEFVQSWRQAVTSFRVVLVAATASGLALVASVMAMTMRLASRAGGSYRQSTV